MTTSSQTSALAGDHLAAVRSAAEHLDAAAHPTIVEALGQESVDQLLASLKGVVHGAADAAEALNASIKHDAIDAKASEITDTYSDESAVTDHGDTPSTIDVDQLRAATEKLGAVRSGVDDVVEAVERILTDEAVVDRLRQEFAAQEGDVDLEIVKGSLASVHPGQVPVLSEVQAAIDHISAAGKDVASDDQAAIAQLQDSLNQSMQGIGGDVERLRDLAISVVDGLR